MLLLSEFGWFGHTSKNIILGKTKQILGIMAKEPEDFSKIEDKFKLSLMQTEKRIVDLEVAFSELSSKIGESKGPEELKQRVDDLEDLAMIETIGVTELKKMMEQIRDSAKPAEPPDLSAIEQKIANLESQVATLPKPEQVDLSGVESHVKGLNETVDSLKESHGGVQSQIDLVINEINSLRKEVGTEIQNIKMNRPEVAIQFLSSRLEALRAVNDEMQKSVTDVNIKLQTLESKAELNLPTEVNSRIENIQQDWLGINSRMDSIEAVVKGFYKTYDALQLELKKFDTFEKASTLKDDLEKKFEEFKFVESEIKRLSGRIEMVYENIDRRLDKVKELERKVPEVLESVEKLAKENDRNKIEILDRVKKDDVYAVKKFVEDTANELNKYSKENITKIMKELEGNKRDLSNIKQLLGSQDTGRISDRISQLEDLIKQHESKIDSKIKGLDEKIRSIELPESPMEEEVKEIVERMILLETRLAAIERLLQESSSIQPVILE